MNRAAVLLALTFGVAAANPAFAQLGALGKIKRGAETAKKVSDMNISEKDELAIGEAASKMLIERFGVYQDEALTKYVTLVGTLLAQASTRPNLNWQFIVLDTDGVNAYAAPGGIVHITRGALAMFKSEAELAGVLGHELTHVTARHTIRAIQKAKGTEILVEQGAAAAGSIGGAAISMLGNAAYDVLFENKFDRDDELESDKVGITLANKAGYSPSGLSVFLARLRDRNAGREEPNGLFATHPLLQERIDRIAKITRDDKLNATAMGEARYASSVTVEAKPISDIAMLTDGVRGVAGGGGSASASKENGGKDAKKEEPKKRGFGLGGLASGLTAGRQQESTQASASAGGRMLGPDTNATGGTSRNLVIVKITPAELAEFRQGIA